MSLLVSEQLESESNFPTIKLMKHMKTFKPALVLCIEV